MSVDAPSIRQQEEVGSYRDGILRLDCEISDGLSRTIRIDGSVYEHGEPTLSGTPIVYRGTLAKK